LQLNQPDDDAFGRFVEAAKSAHVLLPASIGASVGRCAIPKQNPIFPASKRLFFRR
jgi:hypothetical protein